MSSAPLQNRIERRKTRVVMVGDVAIGGENPIRIQSMTCSDTRDAEATAEQIIRLAGAGCEIARVTVQGKKEADACEDIKNILVRRSCSIPLVADIHFYPPAAMRVVEFVDKVRINPGNFADRRASFKVLEYDDVTYAQEIARIEEKFTPLILKCKKLKRSMRIGTNHGSLSDRIMNRYGDTPEGMVESALEYTRVCRDNDFHDIIFSMKSSNTMVMIQAYRLLAQKLDELGWNYPLHLGVTEAGEGEDGRVKSAIGIGALLLDGIGDTIRVSLTEDPWYEIDPCSRLVKMAERKTLETFSPYKESHRDFMKIEKRALSYPKSIPLHPEGSVILTVLKEQLLEDNFLEKIGVKIVEGEVSKGDACVDMLYLPDLSEIDFAVQEVLSILDKLGIGLITPKNSALSFDHSISLIPLKEAALDLKQSKMKDRFVSEIAQKESVLEAVVVDEESESEWSMLSSLKPKMIVLKAKVSNVHFVRKFVDWMKGKDLQVPVILNFDYFCRDFNDLVIHSSAEMGSLLCDKLADGIWIGSVDQIADLDSIKGLSFNILQGSRMRASKTEFISCPSCGRTLFDLQEVSARIRERTAHLPGVKIGIMGCIVNGPGEMADSDFGYVGSRPGKIDLYVGRECVEKNIDFSEADDRLIELIKSHGKWVEPVAAADLASV